MQKLQLEIPLLLPDIPDEQDGCVARLQEYLLARPGVNRAHVIRENGVACLCLHYDPSLLGLTEVRRAAEHAGAALTDRYRHEVLPVDSMDCADCALVIEHSLGRLEGVLSARVNYAAGQVWVEYDTALVRRKAIFQRIEHLGYRVIEDKEKTWWGRNREFVLIGLAGLFVLVAWVGETFFDLPESVAISFYLPSWPTSLPDMMLPATPFRPSLGCILTPMF